MGISSIDEQTQKLKFHGTMPERVVFYLKKKLDFHDIKPETSSYQKIRKPLHHCISAITVVFHF